MNSLGLSSKFPKILLHGPMSLGCLELPDWSLLSICHRLTTIIHHSPTDSTPRKLIAISIQWTQLELGIQEQLRSTILALKLRSLTYGREYPSSIFRSQAQTHSTPHEPTTNTPWIYLVTNNTPSINSLATITVALTSEGFISPTSPMRLGLI